jgi:glycosyltransferase involved in cell wall biosynthesis
MKLVVLLMVRNEAENICGVIDVAETVTNEFVLVDTGSTDNTIDVAKTFCEMRGITLHVYKDEWEGYAHNRCVALGHAYDHGDWVLQLSGDEYLHDGKKFSEMVERLEASRETALSVRVRSGMYETTSPRLVKSNCGWFWEGQIHEYVRNLNDKDLAPASRALTDAWIEHRESNYARKQARYPKDLELLAADNSASVADRRGQFYLGWTLEALGRHDEALRAYDLRLFSSGNPEEEWFVRFRRACCMERCGAAWAEVQDAHLKNYGTRPWRAEPLADIARHWLSVENWELANLFARMGLGIPYPTEDSGIVMHDVYSWRLNDTAAESGLKCSGSEAKLIGSICAREVGPMFPGDPRVMMYCAKYRSLGFDVPVVATRDE